jgi:hypothetical protein
LGGGVSGSFVFAAANFVQCRAAVASSDSTVLSDELADFGTTAAGIIRCDAADEYQSIY